MHFDSEELSGKQFIDIVIYKHSTSTDAFYYDITSIQEVQLLTFTDLRKIETSIDLMFPDELSKLTEERYHLVRISLTSSNTMEWISDEDVTFNDNPFYQLH